MAVGAIPEALLFEGTDKTLYSTYPAIQLYEIMLQTFVGMHTGDFIDPEELHGKVAVWMNRILLDPEALLIFDAVRKSVSSVIDVSTRMSEIFDLPVFWSV